MTPVWRREAFTLAVFVRATGIYMELMIPAFAHSGGGSLDLLRSTLRAQLSQPKVRRR